MPDNDKHKQGGASAISIAVLIIAILTAYPLSAGPAGWIIIRSGRPAWTRPVFESAYAPVFWLQSHQRSRLLNSYFHWWWGD